MFRLVGLSLIPLTALMACQTTEMSATQTQVEVAQLNVELLGDWDGNNVPSGQQCSLHGGEGATPPMRVSGVPTEAHEIIVQYNDRSFPPLSRNGGHGVVAYPATGEVTTLASVPGMTSDLGSAARVVSRAKSTGQYASSGYLPPCSGGRGNIYEAVLKAVDDNNNLLATSTVRIGRY